MKVYAFITVLLYIFYSYVSDPKSKELLFRPRNGVTFSVRTEVPLLKVEYSIYQAALNRLINDWLKQKIGTGQPTEPLERDYIARVNNEVNCKNKCGYGKGMETGDNNENIDNISRTVYDKMVELKVPGHLKVVTSHRRWIRLTYVYLKLTGVEFSDAMGDLVRRHDLSKYTHRDALGYAVMFGDGALGYRKLDTEEEQIEWNNTLYNHFAGNPHHPEYFYPLGADGSPDRSVPVLKLDLKNGKNYLDESLIDMLASRGERSLAGDVEFNVKKWFNIEDRYFRRYSPEDKRYVLDCIEKYGTLAERFFSRTENVKQVTGFFDSRSVVFKNVSV